MPAPLGEADVLRARPQGESPAATVSFAEQTPASPPLTLAFDPEPWPPLTARPGFWQRVKRALLGSPSPVVEDRS